MMFDLRKPLHVLRLPIGRAQPIWARRLPLRHEFIRNPVWATLRGGDLISQRTGLCDIATLVSAKVKTPIFCMLSTVYGDDPKRGWVGRVRSVARYSIGEKAVKRV